MAMHCQAYGRGGEKCIQGAPQRTWCRSKCRGQLWRRCPAGGVHATRTRAVSPSAQKIQPADPVTASIGEPPALKQHGKRMPNRNYVWLQGPLQ